MPDDGEPRPVALKLETQVPAEVRSGEPVPITLRVINTGPAPLELSLLGQSPAFDLTVARLDGAVVWRRLEGEILPMILQLRTLVPGEVLTLSDDWDQRTTQGQLVSPGRYVVHGALLTDDEPLMTPASSVRILSPSS